MTHVNLVPWKCRRRQLLKRRLKQWIWPAALAATILLAGTAVAWSGYRSARAQADQLEQDYAPVERLRGENDALRTRLAELDRQLAVLRQLETPRPPLALLERVSRAAQSCEGKLRVESLLASSAEAASSPTAEKSAKAIPPGSSGTASIKGIAQDNLAVARFVASLRQSKAFERVELKGTEKRTSDGPSVCTFVVECVY